MFRALNETVVEEVNGGQAAVSGKQIRNYDNHSSIFVICNGEYSGISVSLEIISLKY